jgi:tetratricopeptide (TPR) repeat protein
MNSNELSYSEKKIFKALYHFKKNKKKECLNILKEKFNDDPFLEGMRYYLIGLTYNQFGHFFYAIENLEQSIKLFEECQEEDFIVNPLSILALAYCNRRVELKIAEVLDKLLLFKPKTALRKLQIQYANFSYLYLSKQFSKAQKIYRKLIKENLPEFKVYKPYFMILIFMFNVREKNYRKCYEIMEDYSTLSGHMVKVNYS